MKILSNLGRCWLKIKQTSANPLFWFMAYLGLWAICAIVYYDNDGWFKNLHDLDDAFYFSAVTITTLGFGDIIPLTISAKRVVTGEVLLGIFLIGLTLNALSHQKNEFIKSIEEDKYRKTSRQKIIDRFAILSWWINQYNTYARCLLTPLSERGLKKDIDFESITFDNMKDAFLPTAFVSDLNHPCINIFLKSRDNLLDNLITFYEAIEPKYFDEAKRITLALIQTLQDKPIKEESYSLWSIPELKKDLSEIIASIKTKEPTYGERGNVVNAFISLFSLIKKEHALIDNLKEAIATID